MKDWLTVKEAALLTGRGVATIYRWVNDKSLPFTYADDGRTVIVNRQALMEVETTKLRHGMKYRKERSVLNRDS